MNIDTLLNYYSNSNDSVPRSKRPRLHLPASPRLPHGTAHLFLPLSDCVPRPVFEIVKFEIVDSVPVSLSASSSSSSSSSPSSSSSSCAQVTKCEENRNKSILGKRHIASASASASAPVPAPARRLALSRLVGHRHRVTQREQIQQLGKDVSRLQLEIEEQTKQLTMKKHQMERENQYHGGDGDDDDDEYYDLSIPTSILLKNTRTTGSLALLLLELIAMRRNLLYVNDAINLWTLECPDEMDVMQVVSNRKSKTMFQLAMLHEGWASHEAKLFYEEDKIVIEKRCTRCGKARVAGSGHPRSNCDDGFKVGSMIEYRGNV